jgi:O-antigen/teichoic acid export membrane protein
MNVISYISSFLNKGEERTVLLKKNALATLLFQGLNIATQYALVPIVLEYLSSEKYGIWITLSSFIAWFTILDIGLGNGLKNKLSECLAREDHHDAKVYISSSYAYLFIFTAIVYVIFLAIHPFVDWSKVFNTSPELKDEVTQLVFWILSFFIFKNFLGLINAVFFANQKAAFSNYLNFLINLTSFIAIVVLSTFSNNSLFWAGMSLGIPTILIPILATLFYFKFSYAHLRPNFNLVDFSKFKQLFNTGILFFILQLIYIIMFTTDNMIITQLLGPSHVPAYNIAFKYFNVISIAYSLAFPSLWAASTNAYVLKDFDWLKKTISKMMKIWLLSPLVIIAMILLSNFVYPIWTQNKVEVPYILTILMGIYVLQTSFNGILINIINGIGKIKLQVLVGTISAILNIPLSILFVKYTNLGVSGVMLGTLVSLLPQSYFIYIQLHKVVNNKAHGIWDK